ncbi:hypothetical protein HJG60_010591 [Phyllostomus discolor]|uniref:Uncharacterized protein n=1 Tax=Phyllostomus discolor TaxID=89673 RepID=A0A834ALJ1_9CHIR|nr:hypothetical protein HJG60_010591 [Phyllostomus discolor]
MLLHSGGSHDCLTYMTAASFKLVWFPPWTHCVLSTQQSGFLPNHDLGLVSPLCKVLVKVFTRASQPSSVLSLLLQLQGIKPGAGGCSPVSVQGVVFPPAGVSLSLWGRCKLVPTEFVGII